MVSKRGTSWELGKNTHRSCLMCAQGWRPYKLEFYIIMNVQIQGFWTISFFPNVVENFFWLCIQDSSHQHARIKALWVSCSYIPDFILGSRLRRFLVLHGGRGIESVVFFIWLVFVVGVDGSLSQDRRKRRGICRGGGRGYQIKRGVFFRGRGARWESLCSLVTLEDEEEGTIQTGESTTWSPYYQIITKLLPLSVWCHFLYL